MNWVQLLDKINYKRLREKFKTGTDNWKGRKIVLQTITFPLKGEDVDPLRIKFPE
jgi:uncharacterized protein YjbK